VNKEDTDFIEEDIVLPPIEELSDFMEDCCNQDDKRDTWYCEELKLKLPPLKELTGFFEDYCTEEVYDLVQNYPMKKNMSIKHRYVVIFSSGLENAVLTSFKLLTCILRRALAEVLMIRASNKEFNFEQINFFISEIPDYLKKQIRELDTEDIGNLVYVDGFVKSVTDIDSRIKKAAFECLRCGHVTVVEQNSLKFEEPYAGCEHDTCGKKGPFNTLHEESEFVNFQRIQLQELPDSTIGTKTFDITVECEEDLTNKVLPGDKIMVTGLLNLRQKTIRDGKSTLFEKIITAVNIEKQDSDLEDYVLSPEEEKEILGLSQDPEIQTNICRSIAPYIYGHEGIKEAIALLLFSGVRKVLPDGTVLRGNINVALIGDPSTAKSQIVRWVAEVSPRGVFTSGKTVSAAGLTAAVVKDDLNDGWMLQGGAAVVASGGVLCIDEIGQAKPEDKSALHEVMEQGTVSVSKAGIIATLKADCSVLAAGNPKNGYFDRYDPLPEQVGIPPALWSRFDLIFPIYDEPDPFYDNEVSDQVLMNHRKGGIIQNQKHCQDNREENRKQGLKGIEAPIPKDMLRKYIVYSRTNIFPVTPEEVSKYIKEFYLAVRKMKIPAQNSPVSITIRSLEALQRLSEASARMRLSNTVSKEDVDFAKKLIFESLKAIGLDENGILDANLLNGLNSQSQQHKIKSIIKYLAKERSEEELINLMNKGNGVTEDQTRDLIKRLLQRGSIVRNEDGTLKAIN
jgi:replicative DNA helicase Mcm